MNWKIEQLRLAIQNYLGALNEIAEGLKPSAIPEKPEALALYDACKTMNTPLIAGGVMDQPHIWLMEYQVCDHERERFRRLQEINRRNAYDNQSAETAQPGWASPRS